MPDATPLPRVARLGWITVAINLLVIVWGAFVRASGSGAGCGNHWPLCNGAVVPRDPTVETLVELTHRLTSGLALVAVIALLVLARRDFPRGHRVRVAAGAALVLIVIEALIGAGLVRWELVVDNDSMERAVVLGAHLINTQFLLAAIALTAWWAGGHPGTAAPRRYAPGVVAATLALLVVGATGAVASLGNTLFPAATLTAGVLQDLDPSSHLLLRLRVFHPVLAIATGLGVLLLAGKGRTASRTPEVAGDLGRRLGAVVVMQWVLGATTLLTLAPVPLQLLHLLTADVLWICWVLWVAVLWSAQDSGATRTSEARARAASASNTDPAASSR
jgi:heme A synthase